MLGPEDTPDVGLTGPTQSVTIRDLLNAVVGHEGSDLHLQANRKPRIRVNGDLHDIDIDTWDADQTTREIFSVIPERLHEKFSATASEADFSVTVEDGTRFRACAYKTLGQPALVARRIAAAPPRLETLGVPDVLASLADRPQGLMLVTGPTGSGKSTTLSAILRHINESRYCHIITIEDPIEVLHSNFRATVTQREIGVDTTDFSSAIHSAMRQDPDVILIGELRDAATARAALQAAETGHLVLSTMHTNDSAETINRFIDLFPSEETRHIRSTLAGTLVSIVGQRLLKSATGSRVPAVEIMVTNDLIAKAIDDPTSTDLSIAEIIANDKHHGMQTFDQGLLSLVQTGRIEYDTALAATTNRNDFALAMRNLPTAGLTRVGAL